MGLGKIQPVPDSRPSLSVSIVRRNASGNPAANGYQFQHPPAASSCGSVSVSPIPAVCYILLRPPRKLAGPRKNTPDSIRMENTPAPPIALSPIIRLRDWLVKYRVVISTIFFVALLEAKASVRAIVDAQFVHPTFAEGVQSLVMKLPRFALK